MGKKVPLGNSNSSYAFMTTPSTIEEEVELLKSEVNRLKGLVDGSQNNGIPSISRNNKDGIPIGISLVGGSMHVGMRILTVNGDGYYIGETKYESLSSAAGAASGVRLDEWTFWKLPDGRTIEEAFGRL